MDLAEWQERSELDYCLHFAFEQYRQDEDVSWRCFSKTGSDPDVIVRNAGEEDRFLLERRLPNQAFSKMEAIRNMSFARRTTKS